MKKAMVKHGLQALATMLIVFSALSFSATQANAQSTDIILLSQSQDFNWVSEAEAMTVLEAQMTALGNDLAVLTPGTPTYNDMLNHLTYYKLIFSDLDDGLSTMLATNNNLMNVSSANGSQDTNPIPINLNQLYADAVSLLTN